MSRLVANSTSAPARLIALLILAILLAPPVWPEPEDTGSFGDRPTVGPVVGGRLSSVSGEELGLLGDVWADLPLGSPGFGHFFTSWFTRSAITDTTSDFAFTVRDLEYRMDWGWRFHLGNGASVQVMSGLRGRDEVDRRGSAWVNYVALGIASRDFGRFGARGSPLERVSWHLSAGAVTGKRDVQADAIVHGEARARLIGEKLALDLELDGLIGNKSDFDVTIGPSVGFAIAGGRRMSLYVRYLDAGNPLGIRHDAWLTGFEYAEGPARHGPSGRTRGADIGGKIALGAGDDNRGSARMFLRMLAPEMTRDIRIAFTLDANGLTSDTSNELYYLYDVGVERVLRFRKSSGDVRAVTGAYFYHRSNHQFDNIATVTSINVAEAGIQTPGWRARGPRQAGRFGAVDARLRVGYLLNSDFGLDQRWHARGGLSWQMPWRFWAGRGVPYVRAEAEQGDVKRRTFAAGILVNAFEIQVERRIDDQYFGDDRKATLLTVGYAF